MTNPDLLLAMTEAEIGREIIRLVPHWYEAQYGPEQYTIPVGGHTARFCNHCRLTPNLRAFLSKISRPHAGPCRWSTSSTCRA